MAGRWETIPLETAKTHPLYGVGGWLSLIILGSFLAPFVTAVSLYQTYRSIPDLSQLPPIYVGFIIGELAINALMAVWAWTNLWLIFTKRALTVKSLITFLALQPIIVFTDAIAAKYMVEYIGGAMAWDEVFDKDTMRILGRTIVGAAIWIPYMLQSRRVAVTFLNRVRPSDPLAAQVNF